MNTNKEDSSPPKLQPLAPTRSRNKQNTSSLHPRWTEEEDKLLLELASKPNPKWTEIATHFPLKTSHQVSDRWAKVLNPNLQKGSWTGEEDAAIIEWVNEHGPKDWSALAQKLTGRISKQCRERWHNHLSPNVLKAEWTEEEDNILIEAQAKWGNKWSKISTLLPGRTDNSVKNRWNSSLKKRIERMKNEQELRFKRGRKPKRMSEAPQAELPKPDLDETVIKNATEDFSPIKLDSSLNTPTTPSKNWLLSPANGLLSPGLNWSGNQSPMIWNQLNSPFGPLPSPMPLQSPPQPDKHDIIEGIAPPKLD